MQINNPFCNLYYIFNHWLCFLIYAQLLKAIKLAFCHKDTMGRKGEEISCFYISWHLVEKVADDAEKCAG